VEDPPPLLAAWYARLIAPLHDMLPAEGTVLAVEPHGPLWLLPFAALQDAEGGWLGDRWPLLYTPSWEVLDEIRRDNDYGPPTELPLLAVGNPTMPAVPPQGGIEVRLEPLPGAEQEAREVAALFYGRSTLLTGKEAVEGRVIARMREGGVVHLATHGIATADDPLSSFVALAPGRDDGRLTARQVIAEEIPADLVALSACQTGLGQIAGEGMIGLSRAFIVAGARTVLVSQWSVADQATATLMVAFYRAYLAGVDKARALQEAMQALRASPTGADPRYWAPFCLVGAES
jgi:CHAT domain-containing protein